MSLTLPIQVGKQYVRRDGAVVTACACGAPGVAKVKRGEEMLIGQGVWCVNGRFDSPKIENDFDLIADHTPATGHPHAALMAQYAADAAETAEPWLRWESHAAGLWRDLTQHPTWQTHAEYRRKPKTIRIGEHDVPEPVRATPNHDTPYYFPNLDSAALIRGAMWSGVEFDHYMLARGLVHLTREAAEQHARALLAFTQVQA